MLLQRWINICHYFKKWLQVTMRPIFIFSIMFSVWLAAEEKSLSYSECVELALKNNSTIKAAEHLYNAQKELETYATAGFYPEVTAGLSYGKSFLETGNPQLQDSYAGNLSLSQNLFSGFADRNKIREAQMKTYKSLLELKLEKLNVLAEIKQVFIQYRYTFDQLLLSKKILERRRDNLKNVEIRYSSGRENKGSVLLAQAYFQQAQYEILQAEETLVIYKSNLFHLLGSKVPEENIIPEKLNPQAVAKPKILFHDIIQGSLELQQAKTQEQLALISIEKAKSQFYPSLALTGSVGKYDEQSSLRYNKWSLGLSLSWPLFSGGKDYSQYKSALESWKSEKLSERSVEFILEENIKSAYSKYRLSFEKQKVDIQFEQAARLRSQIAKQKYNNGLMSFEDWDKIENELIEKEKNSLASFKDILLSESNWEKVKGEGVRE